MKVSSRSIPLKRDVINWRHILHIHAYISLLFRRLSLNTNPFIYGGYMYVAAAHSPLHYTILVVLCVYVQKWKLVRASQLGSKSLGALNTLAQAGCGSKQVHFLGLNTYNEDLWGGWVFTWLGLPGCLRLLPAGNGFDPRRRSDTHTL